MKFPPIPPTVGGRLFAGVLLTASLSVLDSTLVVPLLSTIATDFGGGSAVAWLVAAYLVTSTVTIPIWGRALDVRGERSIMWASLACFAAGSLLGTLAPNLGILIAARAIQGIGAGGLIPVSQAIISGRCSPQERARLQVYYNGAYGAAAGLGPLIGGALVAVSWRWSFALLLPCIAIAALLLAGRMRSEPLTHERLPFDVRGSVVLTIGLVGILLGIERGQVLAAMVGLLFVAGFIALSLRSEEAVVPRRVITNRTTMWAAILLFLIGFGQYAILTFLPGISEEIAPGLNAGLVVLPYTLIGMTLGAVTGPIAIRIGTRPLAIASVLLMGASMATVALAPNYGVLLMAAGLMGLSSGLAITPTLLLAQRSVAVTDVGAATSLTVLLRNFGGAVGAAAVAVLIADGGVQTGFFVAGVIALLGLLPALMLPRPRQEQTLLESREPA